MWIGTTTRDQLRRRVCWKAEFYCEELPLPVGTAYPSRKLATLVEERKETVDPQSRPEELFRYVGLENVESTTGNLVDFKPRYGREIRSRSKAFHAGDILYGRLRPYLNKVFLAEEPAADGLCSAEFYVLIPRLDRVLPRFLRT